MTVGPIRIDSGTLLGAPSTQHSSPVQRSLVLHALVLYAGNLIFCRALMGAQRDFSGRDHFARLDKSRLFQAA
jgi:hypothetical protein